MNLLQKLAEKKNFTENERIIADYILNNIEVVLNMSIRELSMQTYTSTSTVFRLCKKTGARGYKEFIIKLSRDIENSYNNFSNIDVNFPFSRYDSNLLISKKIAKLSSETIFQTQQALTETILNDAVDMVMKADSLYGVGVSHSFNRIMDFHTKMLRINKFVKIMPLQSDQFHLANSANSSDVAIIVSYGGFTSEIISDVKIFQQKQCKIIALTSNAEDGLATYADIVLPLPRNENADLNISTFASQVAIEYVLNVLYSCIYKRNYIENIHNNRSAPTSFLTM